MSARPVLPMSFVLLLLCSSFLTPLTSAQDDDSDSSPITGISNLTHTLGAGGLIRLTWNLSNPDQVGTSDFVAIYFDRSPFRRPLLGDRFTTDINGGSYDFYGTYGSPYVFLVRVENGLVDSNGEVLYGLPEAIDSAIADGRVVINTSVAEENPWILVDTIPGQIVDNAVFSPNSSLLVVTSSSSPAPSSSLYGNNSSIIIFDAANRTMIQNITQLGRIFSIAFSPNGSLFATASWFASYNFQYPIYIGHEWTGLIKIWNTSTWDEIHTITSYFDLNDNIWNNSTSTWEGNDLIKHMFGQWAIAFSPNGSLLACGGEGTIYSPGNVVVLYNTTTWEEERVITSAVDAIEAAEVLRGVDRIAFSPNGELIGTGGFHGGGKIWNSTTGALVKDLGQSGFVSFSPDGSFVTAFALNGAFWTNGGSVVYYWGGMLEIWNTSDWTVTHSLLMSRPNERSWFLSIAISPDGNQLSLGAVDYTIRVLSPTNWTEIQRLSDDETNQAVSAVFEGYQGGGADNTVNFTNISWRLHSIAYSPDGSLLASSSYDNAISIWGRDSDADGILDHIDVFPYDPNETVDSDGDGVGDNSDAYPNDPDRTKGILPPASEILEGGMMWISIGIGGIVSVIALVLVINRFRNRNEDEDEEEDEYYDDEYAAHAAPTHQGPPQRQHSPDTGWQGEWGDDGYEWLEYPQGSDEWYWRDPDTGQWVRY